MTPEHLATRVMDLVDLLARWPKEARGIDPRAWDHLRVYMHSDAYAEHLRAALQALVTAFVDTDEEGLIEHAEPMIAARAALAKNPIASGEGASYTSSEGTPKGPGAVGTGGHK